jgi:phosphatidylserine decarboxylase
MRIHREGFGIILANLILFAITTTVLLSYVYHKYPTVFWFIEVIHLTFLVLIIQFFRIPNRNFNNDENEIICPADGKIVVIEETTENEFFNDRRIQVSIFMSPLNVHANYTPISGKVIYKKYHPGKFLVAWHPKSSEENERSTFVVEHSSGKSILFRQIAGALARRICFYIEKGQALDSCQEFGFIKFGSRIDLFLPLGSKVNVKIGDKVKAKVTKIGTLV